MSKLTDISNKIAPPLFLLFLALLVVGWVAGTSLFGLVRGGMIGFDFAAVGFLVGCCRLFKARALEMRKAAKVNDANRALLLVIGFVLSSVILAAIAAEIADRKSLDGFGVGLVVVTLILVWTFANALYALHYMHLYYTSDDGGKDAAGLEFPGSDEPNFADFVYFAYTIGAAASTSDVNISSPHIRHVVVAHSVAGFFFNLGVMALTINVIAGLSG